MPRQGLLSADPALWRRRAVRLLLTYLLLTLTLLSARSLTRHVRPDLLAAREQEQALTHLQGFRILGDLGDLLVALAADNQISCSSLEVQHNVQSTRQPVDATYRWRATNLSFSSLEPNQVGVQ